mmetsp:Transcript_46349/g.154660  ORF Transcript_46349/g.154660 Transcript_46349/m.154660 type:complete len:375 (+) Transcript_46349:1036-2160(+)
MTTTNLVPRTWAPMPSTRAPTSAESQSPSMPPRRRARRRSCASCRPMGRGRPPSPPPSCRWTSRLPSRTRQSAAPRRRRAPVSPTPRRRRANASSGCCRLAKGGQVRRTGSSGSRPARAAVAAAARQLLRPQSVGKGRHLLPSTLAARRRCSPRCARWRRRQREPRLPRPHSPRMADRAPLSPLTSTARPRCSPASFTSQRRASAGAAGSSRAHPSLRLPRAEMRAARRTTRATETIGRQPMAARWRTRRPSMRGRTPTPSFPARPSRRHCSSSRSRKRWRRSRSATQRWPNRSTSRVSRQGCGSCCKMLTARRARRARCRCPSRRCSSSCRPRSSHRSCQTSRSPTASSRCCTWQTSAASRSPTTRIGSRTFV